MSCFDITKGVVYNCEEPVIGGIEDRILVGNLDDIDSIAFDVTNKQQITGITLKPGGKAMYQFDQFNRSVDETVTERKSPTYTGFAPVLNFSVFEEGYQQLIDVQAFGRGRFFAITIGRNAPGNADTIFRVYGLDIGLRTNGEMSQSRTNPEFGGVWRVPLVNNDEDLPETVAYYPFWSTDYATTLTAVEALLTPTT